MTVLQVLKLKFTSGNDRPVDRAAITRKEYEELMELIDSKNYEIDRLTAELGEE